LALAGLPLGTSHPGTDGQKIGKPHSGGTPSVKGVRTALFCSLKVQKLSIHKHSAEPTKAVATDRV